VSMATGLQTSMEGQNVSSRSAAALLTLGSNSRLGLTALSVVKLFCIEDETVD